MSVAKRFSAFSKLARSGKMGLLTVFSGDEL
jgi:hypothetical protein